MQFANASVFIRGAVSVNRMCDSEGLETSLCIISGVCLEVLPEL